MSCPNCKLFHNKCQAKCCSFVPFDKEFFTKKFDKIQIAVSEFAPFHDNLVIPITADGTCPFLSSSFDCMIYDERPPICRKFGDASHINMTCAYQTADGQARSNKEFKKISKQQLTIANNFLKQ